MLFFKLKHGFLIIVPNFKLLQIRESFAFKSEGIFLTKWLIQQTFVLKFNVV